VRASDGRQESSASDRALSVGERERRTLTARAGIVSAGTFVSRVLGLGRDLVLAAVFSRGATDAFFVAFTIPNVLRQLLAEGAVQNAVLPVLAKTREQGGDGAARELFEKLRGLSLLTLGLVSVLGVLFAPALVELFAGGFHRHDGQVERTVALTRWVFPYIFFMGSAALGVAALNVYRRFVVTSFAPGLLNVAFIVAALTLPTLLERHGHDAILAMAFGALAGGALQLVAQWPSLAAIGFLGRPALSLSDAGVRETLRRMGPTLLGIGVYYADVVIARRLLSDLDVGAQSYFGWALRLCDFPQGIFVMALQSATLPSLSLLAARGEEREIARTFAYGMRLTLFVGIAATLLFFSLAEPLVVMLFERGEFDRAAAHQTALALMAQGAGIAAVAAVRQLVSVYFALGDTRTPVIVAACDLATFIALAFLLRSAFGHVGIGMAVAGASGVQMLLLWVLLKRRLPDLYTVEIVVSAARTLGVALGAAAAAYGVARAAGTWFGGAASKLLPGGLGALTFAAVFLLLARALRSPELSAIAEPLSRRFRRSR
jgi:putative peptidoglycan lipid II flippase